MPFIGVQPASALLTSADIQDGQITTAKIANDAVDNTKLDLTSSYDFSAGLTLGDNLTFDVAGKGVHLGVTSATASNLLDDYEEGTFTPVSDTNAGTLSNENGVYVKIGRVVYITCFMQYTGASTGSSRKYSGLPFTVSNSLPYTTVDFHASVWSAHQGKAQFLGGTTIFEDNTSALTAGSFSASNSSRVTGFYFTDS